MNDEKVKKSHYSKLANKAARKHASPPPVEVDPVEKPVDINNDTYAYFCLKILPNSMPLDDLTRKILEKSSVEECKLQLDIIADIRKLNTLLFNKKPTELFRDHSCSALYSKILDKQISQGFASIGWKVVAFPILIPMSGFISIFAAPVFHTKKCKLFYAWINEQKVHADAKLTPMTDIFCDENVDQQMGLVEKPTQYTKNDVDWSIRENLENFDNSSDSLESKSSSIDSGKTIQGPIPVINANDISHLNEFDVSTNQDSYLDISFVSVKRRLNLSKQDKMSILEGQMPSSTHSTPIRRNPLHPRLSTSFKKASTSRPTVNRPSYVTNFLNRWFRNNVANMSAELQNELNRMK